MSQLAKNLNLIGTFLHPKKNSGTKYNFRVNALADDLEVTSQTVIKWLKGTKISSTQLKRIANKINNLIDLVEITPEKLLRYDFETDFNSLLNKVNESGPVYYTENINDTEAKIRNYLKKYPYMKPPILEILKRHDKK